MSAKRICALTLAFGLLAIPAAANGVTPQAGIRPLSCADHSIAAGGVRAARDVRAFVQCAYEYVQDMGATEAKRAFHEDRRWRSGPIYVFVDEATSVAGASRAFVFPPDPSREGIPWGQLVDVFGTDILEEINRVASGVGEGWVYYAFTNPETGMTEPKIAYVKQIDWSGTPAVIGAGVYRRDLPGTCREDEVNATTLAAIPSEEGLREFVRCAAMELELNGYFAIHTLATDARWRNGLNYVFGLDTHGNSVFTGYPLVEARVIPAELPTANSGSTVFGGRDVVGVADAFGETFLYYSSFNPVAGAHQKKVAFVKRATVYGLPILVGSSYFLQGHPAEAGGGSGGEPGESGTQYGLSDTAREVRSGVELVIRYDPNREVFTGTVRNTTNQTAEQVRVEVHLSNGRELGPTPNVQLAAGETKRVELNASSQNFTGFSVHVELGPGEHGGGSGEGSEGSGGEGREGGQSTEGREAGHGTEGREGSEGSERREGSEGGGG
ncbi:MAG: cache domain-containing protein [Bryobacterales bacterium]|nr:cache domain-containing protein [Bryobacterales bacterium]